VRTPEQRAAAAAPGSVNAMRGINFRGRGLSERTILALLDQGIDFPEPLLFMEPSLLKKIPGIGKAGINEIMRYRERFIVASYRANHQGA
jgi:hypothetical protein